MISERVSAGGLLLGMLAVAGLAWWLQLRPELRVDASRLTALPLELGQWRGRPVPLESTVENILEADANVQRVYVSPFATEVVWLYVGYYGTHRGGYPEHRPEDCYPTAGWSIEADRIWQRGTGNALRAREFVVAKGGEKRLVHFWYASAHRTGMVGRWGTSLDRLRGRLTDGRADGALVRISTPVGTDDLQAARERLADFQRELAPALASHWPVEGRKG